jgi:hypothetical protein
LSRELRQARGTGEFSSVTSHVFRKTRATLLDEGAPQVPFPRTGTDHPTTPDAAAPGPQHETVVKVRGSQARSRPEEAVGFAGFYARGLSVTVRISLKAEINHSVEIFHPCRLDDAAPLMGF